MSRNQKTRNQICTEVSVDMWNIQFRLPFANKAAKIFKLCFVFLGGNRCQAKFLTYFCLSGILLLRVKI